MSAITFGRGFWSLIVLGLVLAMAACSSGSSAPVVRSGPTTARPPATSAPSSVAPTTPAAAAASQQVIVTPSTGLQASQTVLVQASGFAGNESLVVLECAANGKATTSADCNVGGMQSVTSDAGGRVRVEFTAVKGPFGSAGISCSTTQACLISVTQAVPQPTQEADEHISFG